MSANKWTPGPWYVSSSIESSPYGQRRITHNVFNRDGLYCHIAECGNADNARLVAAVPELLEACSQVIGIIESVENRCMAADGPVTPTHKEISERELQDIYKAVTAALAKARGEQ